MKTCKTLKIFKLLVSHMSECSHKIKNAPPPPNFSFPHRYLKMNSSVLSCHYEPFSVVRLIQDRLISNKPFSVNFTKHPSGPGWSYEVLFNWLFCSMKHLNQAWPCLFVYMISEVANLVWFICTKLRVKYFTVPLLEPPPYRGGGVWVLEWS